MLSHVRKHAGSFRRHVNADATCPFVNMALLLATLVVLCRPTYAVLTVDPATEFGIVTAAPTVRHSGVDADGSLVVWRDRRGGDSIYAYDVSTHSEFIVSGPTGNVQAHPHVSDGLVAWVDGTDLHARDLYGRLWTEGETRLIATMSSAWLGGLDVDGDWVTWIDGGNGAIGDIYAQNLKTGETVTVAATEAYEWVVRIDGSIIAYTWTNGFVWASDRNWNVSGFDLDTRTSFPIENGPLHFSVAGIDGDTVLLEQTGTYGTHDDQNLYVHDLQSMQPNAMALAVTDASLASIVHGRVAFKDVESGRVAVYDLPSAHTAWVSATPTGQYDPIAMTNDLVVWADVGSSGGVDAYFLYANRVPEPATALLCVGGLALALSKRRSHDDIHDGRGGSE